MSWLFSSGTNAQFDELLDKATSELIPPDDESVLLTSLQLSDLIRSKATEPASALKSLRRRLAHKNFNVQILALNVCDILVKNSGEAFLGQVGNGKDGWMAQLEELCKSTNNEVRGVALANVQNWAIAFQSSNTSSSLSNSDLVGMYNRLRYSLNFPPVSSSINSSMITSLSAPEWVDSDLCQRCRTPFTVTNRKHHCRNCGGVFCGDCSAKKRKLEHLGIEQEVRVCEGCYKKLSAPGGGGRSASISKSTAPPAASPYGSVAANSARNSNGKTQEEIDMERAIAMSLADSQATPSRPSESTPSYPGSNTLPGVGYGYEARPSHSAQPYKQPDQVTAPSKQMEEEDPDLAAAIRASLAESEADRKRQQGNAQASTSSYPYGAASVPYEASAPSQPYSYTPQQVNPLPSVPNHELLLSEFDALDSFSSALSPHSQGVQQGSLKPDDANELFYNADKHRGKMVRALQDANTKTEILAELNHKLQRAVRLYDQLLERGIGNREMSRYGQQYHPHGQYQGHQYHPPQQQQQSYYHGQQQPQQPYQPQSQPQSHAYSSHQQQYQPQEQPQPHVYANHDLRASASSPALHREPSLSYAQQPHMQRQASLTYSDQRQPQPSQPYGQTPAQQAQIYDTPSRQSQHADPSQRQQPADGQTYQQEQYQQEQYQQYDSSAPPAGLDGMSQQHESQRQEDAQYYNSQPHPYSQQESHPERPSHQQDTYENGFSASYPASAYPYEQAQPDLSYPASYNVYSQQTGTSPQTGHRNGYVGLQKQHQLSAGYEPAGQASVPPSAATSQPQEASRSDPNKGRLQGYYKPSSFPAVPDNPVGEMGLPSAPNSDFQANGQAHHEQKKQEEALIEF